MLRLKFSRDLHFAFYHNKNGACYDSSSICCFFHWVVFPVSVLSLGCKQIVILLKILKTKDMSFLGEIVQEKHALATFCPLLWSYQIFLILFKLYPCLIWINSNISKGLSLVFYLCGKIDRWLLLELGVHLSSIGLCVEPHDLPVYSRTEFY